MSNESRLSVGVKTLLLDLIEMATTDDYGNYPSDTIEELKKRAREMILSDGQPVSAMQ